MISIDINEPDTLNVNLIDKDNDPVFGIYLHNIIRLFFVLAITVPILIIIVIVLK